MTETLPELSGECFFIAPIGSEGSEERKRSDGILKYIVDRAASEIGLKAVRADQISDPGQINLQIVDHVLRARAAVADVTGLNANVFYEMAIRHTARLPLVIIADAECKLPFDIAQMRTIFFDHTDLASADQCRASIVSHLRQALDQGIVDSPIATSIDLSSMSSGNATERSIAELVTTVEELARQQRDMSSVVESLMFGIHDAQFLRPANASAILDAARRLERLEAHAADRGDVETLTLIHDLREPIHYLARGGRPGKSKSEVNERQRRNAMGAEARASKIHNAESDAEMR